MRAFAGVNDVDDPDDAECDADMRDVYVEKRCRLRLGVIDVDGIDYLRF